MNTELSRLLKNRRSEQSKTIQEAADIIGCRTSSYHHMEQRGMFPKKKARQEKVANFIGISLEELLQKCDSGKGSVNLMPLIKIVALTKLGKVNFSDLEFLLEIQSGLQQRMSPELVTELMQRRSAKGK